MPSTVTITVNSIPALDSQIFITDGTSAIIETFKTVRVNKNETYIGDTPTISGVLSALKNCIELDSNIYSQYRISLNYSTNSLIISGLNVDAFFVEQGNTTLGAITISIANLVGETVFSIDNVAISAATVGNVDTNVKFTITNNAQADSIITPISQAVATNPFIFETARGTAIDIKMRLDTTDAIYKARVPQLLSAYIDIDVKQTPSGAIVTANRLKPISFASTNTYTLLLTFEYSLDGILWQTANSWSGLDVGSYTMYVRDNIGSQITIPFTVDAFSANLVDYEAVSKISNVNSLRFKLNEVWDTNGISKNVSNTLSFEEETKINDRRFMHRFQNNDTIKTQIQTNYSGITAKLIDCEANETDLTVVKKTSNMNIKDVRDGKIKLQSDGSIGIYFGSGNTYNPDTLIQNGSYNMYEFLMDWVNVDDYMNVEGLGWGKVTEIVGPTTSFDFYSVNLSLENTLNYTNDTIVKITTVYNQVDFDRYEFEIDCTALSDSYYVKVNMTDDSFDNKEYISEWFRVTEIIKNHHYIEYYSTKNNEINYGTGISFITRLPYAVPLKWSPNTEQEIYVTDTKTINLDSKVREFYELNLMPLPTAIAQKVILILAHNRIFIDGESYLLEGEPESNPIGMTNTYQVKANLVKANYVFDATQGTTASEILLGSGVPLAIDSSARGLLFIE